MAKRHKRKPSKPEVPNFNGDHGTGTHLANMNTTIRKLDGPNNMGRRERGDWVDAYHKRGLLSDEDRQTAHDLLVAFEGTMKSAPAIKKVNVDSSPKPDHAIEMKLKNIGYYHKLAKNIPPEFASEITRLAVDNKPIEAPNMGHSHCLERLSKVLLGLDKMRRNAHV